MLPGWGRCGDRRNHPARSSCSEHFGSPSDRCAGRDNIIDQENPRPLGQQNSVGGDELWSVQSIGPVCAGLLVAADTTQQPLWAQAKLVPDGVGQQPTLVESPTPVQRRRCGHPRDDLSSVGEQLGSKPIGDTRSEPGNHGAHVAILQRNDQAASVTRVLHGHDKMVNSARRVDMIGCADRLRTSATGSTPREATDRARHWKQHECNVGRPYDTVVRGGGDRRADVVIALKPD